MRFDGKSNPQKSGEITITKLSNVVNPAHTGAVAAIIKTAAITPAEVKKKQFNDALAEIGLGDFYDNIWDMTWALRDSIFSTIEDSDIQNKKEVIQNNIDDFTTAMSSVVSANTVIKQGAQTMKKEEIDAMIKAAVDQLQAKLTTAEAIAKMNDVAKTHYETLDAAGKDAFVKMSAEDQIKAAEPVDVNKGDDESFVMDGQTILKSAVGDATFAVLKSQNTRIEQQNVELKKERETRQQSEFAKMAEGMYPNLPGEHMAKGQVISALKSMNKETQETLEAMLKAGNAAMDQAEIFKSTGLSITDPGVDSPEAKLNKMAEERADKNSISFAKAYDDVLRTERGAELYAKSLKS